MGIMLSITGEVWSTSAQREREKELLFRGDQIAQAIESYYRQNRGGARLYPQELEDLLRDKGVIGTRRPLRKLYKDPMTGEADWELIKDVATGRIMGVNSKSEKKPLKTDNFPEHLAHLAKKKKYMQWQFVSASAQGTPDNGNDRHKGRRKKIGVLAHGR